MSLLQTDICIVGAGPAGATAALFLAQLGVPHVVVDAATFPRDKICGDGLDLKVVRVLRQLDPAIVEHELPNHPAFLPCWGARVTTPNGRRTDFHYEPGPGSAAPPYPPLWLAKRLHFDTFLVEKFDMRYTDFHPGMRVTAIERAGQRWRLQAASTTGKTLEINAKLLLGADGDHSIVLRHLGERKIDRGNYAGTLRQYWRGIRDVHPRHLIELYFPPQLPLSYFYFFPLPDGEVNVGYGMVSDIVARRRHNLRELFQRLIERDPVLAPRFAGAEPLEEPTGWGIPLASRGRRTYGDGYLLLGDAGSLVCPTSGEGIGTAMMSGYLAAHFVKRALGLGRTDAGVFENFNREVYRRLQDEIRVYRLMRRYLPWRLYEWGLNVMTPAPLLQHYFPKLAAAWLRTAYEKPIAVQF
jgi:geranylgeranyl reductase family protein